MKLGELKDVPFSGPIMIVRYSDGKILTIIDQPECPFQKDKYQSPPSWLSDYKVIDIQACYRDLVSSKSYPVIAIILDGDIKDF